MFAVAATARSGMPIGHIAWQCGRVCLLSATCNDRHLEVPMGRRVVGELVRGKDRRARALCECSCGAIEMAVLCGDGLPRNKQCRACAAASRNCGPPRGVPRFNLVGRVYGELTVTELAPSWKRQTMWWCACTCGNVVQKRAATLANGTTTSCGCLRGQRISAAITRHGMSKTTEHYIWLGLRSRCLDKNNAGYRRYGGRGITVCERWRNSFAAFFADMGERPADRSIDRINNDGNYSCGKCEECVANGWPANCRWATDQEQARNSTAAKPITIGGVTKCVAEWAEESPVQANTVYMRLWTGWPPEDAVFAPLHTRWKAGWR